MIKHKPTMKKQKSEYTHGSAMHDSSDDTFESFNKNDVSDDDNELDPTDEKHESQTNSKDKTLAALPTLTIWGNHQFEMNINATDEIEDNEFLDDVYYDELDQVDDIKDDTQNETIRQYLIKEIVDSEESYVQ
eukprot:286471_1